MAIIAETLNEKNPALEQANAQMASVREMVARLSIDWGLLAVLRDEKTEILNNKKEAEETVKDMESCPEYTEEERRDAYDELADTEEEWLRWETTWAKELAELEALADGCEDREDAEQRIIEDALSVEVRGDWQLPTPADGVEFTDFRIVLCTGGPHVQIRGELENGEPSRAWLEYQGWGTPMTERVNDEGDQDALLTYARCFYFGE